MVAQKHHPDVSKEPNAKERFQEVSEAYETLRDKEKRAAYDNLGSQTPGQDFRPSHDWYERFGERFGAGEAEDLGGIDLSDLFESLGARILAEEHRIYTDAVRLILSGNYRIEGRRVIALENQP